MTDMKHLSVMYKLHLLMKGRWKSLGPMNPRSARSRLKDVGILKTWNSIGNVVEPISNSIIKVPITFLLVLSYALTVYVKGPKSEGA